MLAAFGLLIVCPALRLTAVIRAVLTAATLAPLVEHVRTALLVPAAVAESERAEAVPLVETARPRIGLERVEVNRPAELALGPLEQLGADPARDGRRIEIELVDPADLALARERHHADD